MAVTLPTFTPLEDSLFLTLYARALDNHRPHPILGDATADQIVRATDYDYDQLKVDTNLTLSVALRAKKLDQVASEFLARHPDAIGLDLGAGLDTRFERLAPPATVDWYDVDFPARTWSQSTPTCTSSAPTCGTRTGWSPSPATGRPSSRPTG